jgi:hypothetical protein
VITLQLNHMTSNRTCRNPSFGLAIKAKGLQGCEPRGSPRVKAKRSQRCGPRRNPRVTSHTSKSVRKCEGVWGSEPSHSQGNSHFGEMESWWTPKFSESNFRGQNSMACYVLYIIGKLLERRCLKWAHIVHFDIWNTSYGQKKGRESNCQFDSRSEKVKNRPDLLSYRGCVTYRWKALDKSYNFASDRISIRGLVAKLWGSKVTGVPTGAISRLSLGNPRREKPFGCELHGQPQSII